VTHVIDKDDLSHSETGHRFEGYLYGGANVSFFLIDTPRGDGSGLRTHPYDEVFVAQEGEVTTVGDATIEAKGGQILVVPAGVPHKYVNSGEGWARHIDIHASGRMTQTEWPESKERQVTKKEG